MGNELDPFLADVGGDKPPHKFFRETLNKHSTTDTAEAEATAEQIDTMIGAIEQATSVMGTGIPFRPDRQGNYQNRLGSPYGIRPRATGGSGNEMHYGQDITGGDHAVVAPVNGTIYFRQRDAEGLSSYGKYIILKAAEKYNDRDVYILFGHLASYAASTTAGQAIRVGQSLGTMGSTGRSIGTHLHYEVRLGAWRGGEQIDPVRVYPQLEKLRRR